MKTELDWSHYHDQGMGDAYADIPRRGGNFAKAVSVCIRSGVCEQPNKGVMCPSFRISGHSQLSPGGRVRLLKQVLNSDAPLLSSRELDHAMALCVACKGCKRECENNVDMALIKAEYLAQKRKTTRLPLRSRLFAYLPFLLSRHPWLRHLIRWRNRSVLLAKLTERLLGLAAAMPLPEMAATPFAPTREVYPPLGQSATAERRSVVLLLDCFTTLFAPEVAQDALTLLRHAGYHVWIIHPGSGHKSRPLDSGRTLLTQGLVAPARREAQRLLAALGPHLARQRPIIGLEPSTLLMLRDEYQALAPGEPARQAGELALLLEEFIARERVNGRFTLPFKDDAGTTPVLVHGHCHQKAVGAMKSMRKALRLLPGLQADFIESSCCGMGGSFGFEAEHAAASKQMAELSLVPQIRARPDATLVCNGFGCAHQIVATTGRRPLHLASLLASRIATPTSDQ